MTCIDGENCMSVHVHASAYFHLHMNKHLNFCYNGPNLESVTFFSKVKKMHLTRLCSKHSTCTFICSSGNMTNITYTYMYAVPFKTSPNDNPHSSVFHIKCRSIAELTWSTLNRIWVIITGNTVPHQLGLWRLMMNQHVILMSQGPQHTRWAVMWLDPGKSERMPATGRPAVMMSCEPTGLDQFNEWAMNRLIVRGWGQKEALGGNWGITGACTEWSDWVKPNAEIKLLSGCDWLLC